MLEKIGVDRRCVFALLTASLLGSYVNIPIGELAEERALSNQVIRYFGMKYARASGPSR